MVFHVLNRGVGRMRIFRAEKDYQAFQRAVEQIVANPTRLSWQINCLRGTMAA